MNWTEEIDLIKEILGRGGIKICSFGAAHVKLSCQSQNVIEFGNSSRLIIVVFVGIQATETVRHQGAQTEPTSVKETGVICKLLDDKDEDSSSDSESDLECTLRCPESPGYTPDSSDSSDYISTPRKIRPKTKKR